MTIKTSDMYCSEDCENLHDDGSFIVEDCAGCEALNKMLDDNYIKISQSDYDAIVELADKATRFGYDGLHDDLQKTVNSAKGHVDVKRR